MTNKVVNFDEFIQEYIQVNEPVSGDYRSPTGLVEGVANRPSRQLQEALSGLSVTFGFSGSNLKSELVDSDVPLLVNANIGFYFIKNKVPTGNYSNLTFDQNNTYGRSLSDLNQIKVLYNSTSSDITLKNVYDCITNSLNFIVPARSAVQICWNGLDKWVANLIPSISLNPVVSTKHNNILRKWAQHTTRPCDIIPGNYTVTTDTTSSLPSGTLSQNLTCVVSIIKNPNLTRGTDSRVLPVVKQTYVKNNESALVISLSDSNTAWKAPVIYTANHATNSVFGTVQTLENNVSLATYKRSPNTYNTKVVTGQDFFSLRSEFESIAYPDLIETTEDPNTTLDDWILTSSSNTPKNQYILPNNNRYNSFYVNTKVIRVGVGNLTAKVQFAIPKSNARAPADNFNTWASAIFVRQYIPEASIWTPWTELGLSNQVTSKLKSLGLGYRETDNTLLNVDLNSLSGANHNGYYYANLNSSVATPSTKNFPGNSRSGFIEIHNINERYCVQVFHDFNSDHCFIRQKANNIWKPWKSVFSVPYSSIINKPTTLAGYGITDSITVSADNYKNTNRSANDLLGQNKIVPVSGGDRTILGFDSNMYNYGLLASLSAGPARTLLYAPHSIGQLWISNGYQNNSQFDWKRIDGADWSEVRNKPTTLDAYGTTSNRNLTINTLTGNPRLLGNKLNSPSWVVGTTDNSDDLLLYSYINRNGLTIKPDRTELTKALYISGSKVLTEASLTPVKDQNLTLNIPNTQTKYEDATPKQLPVGTFVGLTAKAKLDGRTHFGWSIVSVSRADKNVSGEFGRVRLGIDFDGNLHYQHSASDGNSWKTPKTALSNTDIVSNLTSENADKVLSASMGKALNESIVFRKIIVKGGNTPVNLDLSNKEQIKAEIGSAYVGYGVYILTFHNSGSHHSIENLPLGTVRGPVEIKLNLMGAYSFIECTYIYLQRRFICPINWNNPTFRLDWTEHIMMNSNNAVYIRSSSDRLSPTIQIYDENINLDNTISKRKIISNIEHRVKSSNNGIIAIHRVHILPDKESELEVAGMNKTRHWVRYLTHFSSNGATNIGGITNNGRDRLQVSGTASATAPNADANNDQLATTAWIRSFISNYFNIRFIEREDLNQIIIPGMYAQGVNVNATSERHYPVHNKAGCLIVKPSAYGQMQEYTTYDFNEVYIRNKKQNGSWSDWVRIDGSDWSKVRNKPTTLGGYGITDAISIAGGTINGNLNLTDLVATGSLKSKYRLIVERDSAEYPPYINIQDKGVNLNNTLTTIKDIFHHNIVVDQENVAKVKAQMLVRLLQNKSTNYMIRTTNSEHSVKTNLTAFGQTGNVAIGKETDSGEKLQVNGSITGSLLDIKTNAWAKVIATHNNGAKWVWETHPDGGSTNDSTRFNFKWLSEDNQTSRYVAFPDVSSKNEVVAYKSWVTSEIRKVVRRDYSRTIVPTQSWASRESISITGSTHIYPDGSIRQIFHLKALKFIWFTKQGEFTYKIPLQLWTAMPNKILDVNVKAVKAVNVRNAQDYGGEAGEWIAAWALADQGTNKDRIIIDTNRLEGGSDEHVDLYVTVEGY